MKRIGVAFDDHGAMVLAAALRSFIHASSHGGLKDQRLPENRAIYPISNWKFLLPAMEAVREADRSWHNSRSNFAHQETSRGLSKLNTPPVHWHLDVPTDLEYMHLSIFLCSPCISHGAVK